MRSDTVPNTDNKMKPINHKINKHNKLCGDYVRKSYVLYLLIMKKSV